MSNVKICGAVHVEKWTSDGIDRDREVRCTLPPGHAGRHGWELDKGGADYGAFVSPGRLRDPRARRVAGERYDYVCEWKISQLVACFASSATRHHAVVDDGLFDLAVARELDRRWAALEARVEALENLDKISALETL